MIFSGEKENTHCFYSLIIYVHENSHTLKTGNGLALTYLLVNSVKALSGFSLFLGT